MGLHKDNGKENGNYHLGRRIEGWGLGFRAFIQDCMDDGGCYSIVVS